jgi:SAM-dependent methyltransferase
MTATAAVWRLLDGHASYWAVAGAAAAGVLDSPPASDPRLAPLLSLLVDVDVLERDGDSYRPTATGEAVRAMRGVVLGSPGRHENWLALGDTLRGADPPHPVDDDTAFRVALARATYPVQHELATRVAAHLAPSLPTDAVVVVDVSPALDDAPRAWSDAFAAVPPRSGDWHPPGVPITQSRADGGADVVLVPHVCREGRPAAVLSDARRLAKPGGVIVIADYFLDAPDPDRARRAAVLGLTMVANTTTGTTYPESAYRAWLAGCAVERFDGAPAPHDVLIARTPEENA